MHIREPDVSKICCKLQQEIISGWGSFSIPVFMWCNDLVQGFKD
ncbi:hypothetical protein HanRHA438_Chr03g0121081 [Helianthus annuus]|nr:hypothetical protein HanRHA438_Chr03g0121081 [Helianthus annuus]